MAEGKKRSRSIQDNLFQMVFSLSLSLPACLHDAMSVLTVNCTMYTAHTNFLLPLDSCSTAGSMGVDGG
jgi:hypothetical protein